MSILNDELIDAKANLCWNHQQQQLKKEVEIDCICAQLADMIYLTRQEIAKDIMRAHDGSSPMAKCYDIGCLDVVCSHEEDAKIARGE